MKNLDSSVFNPLPLLMNILSSYNEIKTEKMYHSKYLHILFLGYNMKTQPGERIEE